MDTIERRILTFTSIGHFFTHFTMLLFPPLATTIARDLGLELDRVFFISFLMYLLYGVGAMPWGYLADRWNPRLVLVSGIIMAGIGLVGAGIIRNPTLLPLTLAVVGLGNAAYHPAGLSLVSKGIRSRGRGMGLNGVFGNFGIALAPFMAGILGWTVGWRLTFIIFGTAGILGGLSIALVPFSVSRLIDRQKGQSVSGSKAITLFIILCVAVISAGLMYRSFTLILPSWLEGRFIEEFNNFGNIFDSINVQSTDMGKSSLIAAIVSGMTMVIGMGGQLVGGIIADRIDLRKAYLLFFLLALPFLLAARFVSGWMTLPFIGLFSFFALGMQPIENSLYSMLVPPRWRSSGFGIKFTITFGIGSLAVFIVSKIEPLRGLDGVMTLTALYLLLTVITSGFLLLVSRGDSIKHLHEEADAV